MRVKTFLLVMAVILATASFTACAPQAGEQAEWSIAIVGAEKTEFTSADYASLKAVNIEATLKTKDGNTTTQKYEGVPLKDVLESLGVSEYTSVTVEASDYAKDYTPDIVNDPLTVLAVKADGQPLGKDIGPVESVAGSQRGNMWIKNVSKITVNK